MHDPNGVLLPLSWGPEPHEGTSNYDRPGDERGMGINFKQQGCWQVAMIRDADAVADFWFSVE